MHCINHVLLLLTCSHVLNTVSSAPARGKVSFSAYLVLQLLAKLLPALVQKLATAQPKTRAKVSAPVQQPLKQCLVLAVRSCSG
jgi:hypothetical protein